MTVTCDISKTIEWDSGHRVPNHQTKCRHPHGHRYKLQATCTGKIVNDPTAPDDGMLVDFSDLKTLLTTLIHDPLDHAFIYQHNDPIGPHLQQLDPTWHLVSFPYPPTAENIARWAWEQLYQPITTRFRDGLTLKQITVWETPTSVAYYTGPHTND